MGNNVFVKREIAYKMLGCKGPCCGVVQLGRLTLFYNPAAFSPFLGDGKGAFVIS